MAYYYDIENDIRKYPNATTFIVFGGRDTGKTYSTLNYVYTNKKKFVFIKRTMDDIKLLCNGLKYGSAVAESNKFRIDSSPFKSLNRDKGWNVKAFEYYSGVGGFYNCTPDGETVGDAIGYLFALSGITKFKGFDLADCEYIIFDEFCPKPYDRINKKEGEQLLDLYKTVERDRIHRGLPPLKLILLANSDNAVSPVTQTFNVTDDIVNLSLKKQEYLYDDNKHMLLHSIRMSKEFMENESKSDVYAIAKGTAWEKMALENEFGFNDFSQVKKQNLRHYRCYARVFYQNKYHFIYINERGEFYITFSPSKHYSFEYDLTRDKDKFDFTTKAKYDIMRRKNVWFESYSLYYLYYKCDKIL